MPSKKPASSSAALHPDSPRTITHVAREAGVSLMTVSRVVNTPHLVSEESRKLVLDAMARIGYVPNLHAAGLRSRRTRMIACMVPTIASGSAFLSALQAMTEVFRQSGYQVMLSERGYDRSRDDAAVEAVLQRRPDGIALIGAISSDSARARLRGAGIPVVETWEMTEQPVDLLVGFSHEEIGRAVARYLHTRGRQRLASISSDESRTRRRYDGFRDEAIKLGIAGRHLEADTSLVMDLPSRLLHGRTGLAAALEGDPKVDAIFSATDMVALGTLVEARERGLRVPEDLAVVGFGDFDFAEHVSPTLTTVRVDNQDIGRRAADLLIARIDGHLASESLQDVGFQLVTRASA